MKMNNMKMNKRKSLEQFSHGKIALTSSLKPSFNKISKYKKRSNQSILLMTDKETYEGKISGLYGLKLKNISIPLEHQNLINFWNDLELHAIREGRKKSLLEVMREISMKITQLKRGTLFKYDPVLKKQNRKFTEKEIRRAIYNFHLAALNKDYEPREGEYKTRLSKIPMSAFLYNAYALKEKSLFLSFYKHPPKLIGHPIDEKVEDVKDQWAFGKVMSMYRDKVLGHKALPISSTDLNRIKLASNKIVDFYEEQKGILDGNMVRDSSDLADYFCSAIELAVDNEQNGDWARFPSGYLTSETTFKKRLPSYLNSQAALVQQRSFSIYDTPPDAEVYGGDY